MTGIQKKECNKIIHIASVVAGGAGAGLAQIPGGDRMLITPIQVTMTVKLAKIFGVNLSESAATALLTSGAVSSLGRAVAGAIVGRVPILGNIVNAATAAVITEALGWAVAREFDCGEIIDKLLLVKDAMEKN